MKRFFRGLCAAVLILAMLVSSASALTVEQALELLEWSYLRDIPAEACEAETLDELFSLLGDPYTYYMTAEEYQAFLDAVENTVSVVGIGVSIQYTEKGILVVDVLKGGSAEEAGLQPGDLIVKVDGVSCVPAEESHRALIAGEEGTRVFVVVVRNGVRYGYTLERRTVVIPNTGVTLEKGHVGYIDCSSFGLETGELILEGVETYADGVDTWVMDLRGNSGGYTTAAVDALGIFGGPGYYLYLMDKTEQLYYYLCLEEAATDLPLVVLVDGGSASASEAFAAGIRDMGRGILVGTRTFGKGSAQVIYDAETHPELFGEDGIKLTAYRFYSYAGVTNDVIGVIPTLLVSDEMAQAVALAICGDPEAAREEMLVLQIGAQRFGVNLAETDPAVLEALFGALPPGTYVFLYEDGIEYDVTLEEGAAALGFTCGQRWFSDVADSAFVHQINTLATYDILHGDGEGSFRPGDTLTRAEACAMLAKTLGLSASGRQFFADVPDDHPYASYINAMAAMGFVQGRGDGNFCPDQTLTQEEYFTILARVACYQDINFAFAADAIGGEQLEAARTLGFSVWARSSAALLEMAGALRSSVHTLEPTAPILREEAAAGLYEVLTASGILPE